MKKGLKKAIIILAVLLLGVGPLFADGYTTARTGTYPASTGITGVDQDGLKRLFGQGAEGETAPTVGLFPICGIGSDGKSYQLSVGSDGKLNVSIDGTDFGTTLGTSIPEKGVLIAGKDASGNARAVLLENDGTVKVSSVITEANFAGATGSASPSDAVLLGADNGGNLTALKIDGNQELYVRPGSAPWTVTIAGTNFSAQAGTNVAPNEIGILGGKTENGNYQPLAVGEDGKLNVSPAADSAGHPKQILANDSGIPFFRFADAESASSWVQTTDKTAVATPGAGNSLVIHRFSLSAQNACLVEVYLGATVVWQSYLAAGGYAEVAPGLPLFGSADEAFSAKFGSANGTCNVQYEELVP